MAIAMTSILAPCASEPSVRFVTDLGPVQAAILTPEALAFVADLHCRFDARRQALLARRRLRQQQLDAGEIGRAHV